jgi:FKBP-type peptidyl-prolyl cis-trans isomerase
MFGCQNRSEDRMFKGYKQTPSGLYYQFHKQGGGEQVQINDELFSVVRMYWCDEFIDMERTDSIILGPLEPPRFSGDLVEGLLMMRVGDSASFLIPADSVVKHWNYDKGFEHHLCDYLRVTVRVDIRHPFDTAVYLQQLEIDSVRNTELQNTISEEHIKLKNHVRRKHPNAEPNSDGVYVVILRKGKGTPVSKGKTAVFEYTARLLDGTIWDSSDEEISYQAGIIFPQRIYKPQEILIGENQWFVGLDNALIGQTVGSSLRLFMPSDAVFGHKGNRFVSEFQSTILEIDLLEVK